MLEKIFSKRNLLLLSIIVVAAFTRLIPHYPNFTAIGAVALFGGAYFHKKYLSFAVPFIALFITDLIIGFHATMWAVYVSFAIIVMIGFSLRGQFKIAKLGLSVVSASVLFFIITNFAAWLSSPFYPQTFVGLIESYVAAIPFFQYNLLGDLFFGGIIFGIYEFAKLKYPSLIEA